MIHHLQPLNTSATFDPAKAQTLSVTEVLGHVQFVAAYFSTVLAGLLSPDAADRLADDLRRHAEAARLKNELCGAEPGANGEGE